MNGNAVTPAKVLLFGLDGALSMELRHALGAEAKVVWSGPASSVPDCLHVIRRESPELVFCGSDRRCVVTVLEAVRQVTPRLPVVVASPYPEVGQWLDAIEAGAADYCAAPFEISQIQWIIRNSVQSARYGAIPFAF